VHRSCSLCLFIVFQAKQAHGHRGACRCNTLCLPCHLRVLRRPHPSVSTDAFLLGASLVSRAYSCRRSWHRVVGRPFCTTACADCDGGGLEGRGVDKLNVYKAHLHHHFHIIPRLHRAAQRHHHLLLHQGQARAPCRPRERRHRA